jgi:ferredoxin-NADP reductase
MPAPTVQAVVLKTGRVSAVTTLLTLKMEEGFTFAAGQFVSLHVPPEPDGDKPLKGHYSVASPPSRLPELELLVEHHESGPQSGHVSGWVSGLQPGQTLALEGPYGKFGLLPQPAFRNFFLATGAGLAPLRSMILSLQAPRWLFLGSSGADLLLDPEWKALQAGDGSFHYVPVLQAFADNPWIGKQADPADVLLRHVKQREDVALYLAGFNREVEPMHSKLLEAGFRKEDIRVEKFG